MRHSVEQLTFVPRCQIISECARAQYGHAFRFQLDQALRALRLTTADARQFRAVAVDTLPCRLFTHTLPLLTHVVLPRFRAILVSHPFSCREKGTPSNRPLQRSTVRSQAVHTHVSLYSSSKRMCYPGHRDFRLYTIFLCNHLSSKSIPYTNYHTHVSLYSS